MLPHSDPDGAGGVPDDIDAADIHASYPRYQNAYGQQHLLKDGSST